MLLAKTFPQDTCRRRSNFICELRFSGQGSQDNGLCFYNLEAHKHLREAHVVIGAETPTQWSLTVPFLPWLVPQR